MIFILNDLERKYNVVFRYNEEILPKGFYDYQFDGNYLIDALKVILYDKGLAFTIRGNEIFIAPGSPQDLPELKTKDDLIAEEEKERDQRPRITIGKSGREGNALLLGLLTDQDSGLPVAESLIFADPVGEFTTSSSDGSFKFDLPPGNYTLRISSLTFDTYLQDINLQGDGSIEIPLKSKTYVIDEVVVEGTAQDQITRETSIGLTSLNRREIKQLNSFLGDADVIKSLSVIAGVKSIGGEGAGGINIRGGTIDQNLVLLDGTPVLNPFHVLGFFSVFNADAVGNTELYKGHVPARYGGRTSAVLDIDMKDARPDFFSGNFSAGLVYSKVNMDIPVLKRSAITVGGRQSYTGWFVSNVDIDDSSANFNDFHVKFIHPFSDRTKLTALYFQSSDDFTYSDQFGFAWKNRVANIRLRHQFSDNFNLNAYLGHGKLSNEQTEPDGINAFNLSTGIAFNEANVQALFIPGNHEIRFGAEGRQYTADPEVLIAPEGSLRSERTVDKDNGRELSAFISDEWKISDKISIEAGVRFTQFDQTGPDTVWQYTNNNLPTEEGVTGFEVVDGSVSTYSHIQPRVSARIQMNEFVAFKAGYNRTSQYLQLISNTAAPTPVDIWQVSNSFIPAQAAHSYSAGLFGRWPKQRLDLSAEVYYRTLDHQPEYRDFASLLVNRRIETQLIDAEGRAYGLELSAVLDQEKYSARLSYDYSRSERRVTGEAATLINTDGWYPANYDQPHTVKAFGRIKTGVWASVNINFIYSTGRPITAPNGNYIIDGVIIPDFSTRNAFRLPDYHRLDIAYTFPLTQRTGARVKAEMTAAFYNVYGRKNAFSVFFRQRVNNTIDAFQLSVVGNIIPALSLNIKW